MPTTTVTSGKAGKANIAGSKTTPAAAKPTSAKSAAAAPKPASAKQPAPAPKAAQPKSQAKPAASQQKAAKPQQQAKAAPPTKAQSKLAAQAKPAPANAPKQPTATPAAGQPTPAAPKKVSSGAIKKVTSPKKGQQIQKKSHQGVRKQVLKGKGQKKKKVSLKFVIDCTHPYEDKIMDVANFVSFSQFYYLCYTFI